MIVSVKNVKTGEDEWVVQEEGDDSKGLIAASSYLDMLTDCKRNRAYRVALERVLSHRAARQHTVPTVLDIGTGTGLLAIMAAHILKHQRSPQQQPSPAAPPVIACELFPTMARVAMKVVEANGCQQEVAVVDKRSDELVVRSEEEGTSQPDSSREAKRRRDQADPDMASKADVIVTEIFDSALLGEGLLPSMRHSAKHLLKEGHVIPARAIVWVQLVHCPPMLQWTGPVCTPPSQSPVSSQATPAPLTERVQRVLADLDVEAIEHEEQGKQGNAGCWEAVEAGSGSGGSEGAYVFDVDMGSDGSGSESERVEEGPACRWQELHELHVDAVQAQSQLTPLSRAVPVLEFDLADPPPDNQALHGIKVPVSLPGTAHGLVLWWQLDMLPKELHQHHQQQQQPQQTSSSQSSDTFWLSTAPEYVGTDVSQGGDGGPLQGVRQEWRGHWAQCWSRLGGAAGLQVQAGQNVALSVKHDDTSIQLALTPAQQPSIEPAAAGEQEKGEGLKNGQGHSDDAPVLPPLGAWLPPHSMQQLNGLDGRWASYEASLCTAMRHCRLQTQQGALEIVCMGSGLISPDQLMPPLLASACAHDLMDTQGSAQAADLKVTALADHGAARKWLTAAGHRLSQLHTVSKSQQQSATEPSCHTQRGTVLHVQAESSYMKRARHAVRVAEEQGTGQQQQQQGVVLLIGDPSYHQGKGAAPCMHLLQFWSDMDFIRRAEVAKGKQVVCFPAQAVLRAVVASIPHMARTRLSLNQVEGVDLSAANSVLGGDRLLELSLGVPWQCGGTYTELSSRTDLMTLDLTVSPFTSAEKTTGSVDLHVSSPSSSIDLHAVVVWVDYEAGQTRIDNGPHSSAYSATQTVLCLPAPLPQEQVARGVRVSVQLEEHGLEFTAERIS